jgi:hypothetical protein
MATKVFLHDLNLNFNQLLNAKFQVLATDPVAPQEGQFWFNSAEDRVKYYDGVSTQLVANLNDITGLLDYKGGYDAAANTPNLDATPTAGTIFKGDTYTVTVAGTFYTEDVQVGDMLIAEIDDPAALSDWTLVERNQNPASTTVAGYIRLATQAEVNAGVATDLAVSPATLQGYLATLSLVESFTTTVSVGTAQGAVNINHGLGSTSVIVSAYLANEEVGITVTRVDANNITVEANGATVSIDVVVIGG